MFACLVACLRGRQWEKVARVFVLCVRVVRLCARQCVCVWMMPGVCYHMANGGGGVCAGVMDGMRARVDAMPCVCVCVYVCGCVVGMLK